MDQRRRLRHRLIAVGVGSARTSAHGHEVIAASSDNGVNTITGEGLKYAMAGTSVVIDLANSRSFEEKAVLERSPPRPHRL